MSCADELMLDSCIKCSICVAHCPVARVSDQFAGPKQNGPDLERFRLEGPDAVSSQAVYCTNCKNCDVACPSGVSVSAMISRAKGELVARQGAALRDRLMARTELLGRANRISPALVNWCTKSKPLRRLGEKIFGISAEMTLPRYAEKTFYDLYALKNQFFKENLFGAKHAAVVYFPGCYVIYNRPEAGLALMDVLVRNGVRVLVDRLDCCGLPLISNGFLTEARKCAQKNIQQLEGYFVRGYQVITSCPSCFEEGVQGTVRVRKCRPVR